MPKINVINDKTGEVKEIECIGFNLKYVTDGINIETDLVMKIKKAPAK